MSKQGKLISCLVVITMMLTNIFGIVAAENHEVASLSSANSAKDSIVEPSGDACTNPQNIEPASEEDARYFERLVLRSEEFRSFKRNLFTDYHGEFRPKWAERYSLAVEDNVIAVYVPIEGGTGDSFYGIWFDKGTDTVLRSISGVFEFDSDQNVNAKFEHNGSLLVDAVITQEGIVLSAVTNDTEGNQIDLSSLLETSSSPSPNATGSWWNCMTDCLAQMGVPLYLVAGLGIVCAAACVITAGFACGACIAAALGAWSATGTYCLLVCG